MVVCLRCGSGERCLGMGGVGGLMGVGLEGSDVVGKRSGFCFGKYEPRKGLQRPKRCWVWLELRLHRAGHAHNLLVIVLSTSVT